MWDLSSLTGDRVRAPALGAQSLNHWTAREVPNIVFFKKLLLVQGPEYLGQGASVLLLSAALCPGAQNRTRWDVTLFSGHSLQPGTQTCQQVTLSVGLESSGTTGERAAAFQAVGGGVCGYGFLSWVVLFK